MGGRKVQEERNICVHIAVSLYSTAETNTGQKEKRTSEDEMVG